MAQYDEYGNETGEEEKPSVLASLLSHASPWIGGGLGMINPLLGMAGGALAKWGANKLGAKNAGPTSPTEVQAMLNKAEGGGDALTHDTGTRVNTGEMNNEDILRRYLRQGRFDEIKKFLR